MTSIRRSLTGRVLAIALAVITMVSMSAAPAGAMLARWYSHAMYASDVSVKQANTKSSVAGSPHHAFRRASRNRLLQT